jgi:sec-independent protein translocase protein TatC
LFAYFAVLPRALTFFYEWSGSLGVSNDWRIGEYISFATQFTLLFGVAFELPVVVMVFVKLGLLTYETMIRTRSYAIVAIFVTAAILTPTPDIFTLLLMAAPMIILYEICIWLAWLDRRKNRIREEEEARERAERDAAAGLPEPDDAETREDEDFQVDPYADNEDESGDDGWSDDYPEQDFPETPELPDEKTDASTDDENRPDEPR